jgi:hypothetical protein
MFLKMEEAVVVDVRGCLAKTGGVVERNLRRWVGELARIHVTHSWFRCGFRARVGVALGRM